MIGQLFALSLTVANAADMQAVPDLLPRLNGARYLIVDKGYDLDGLRRELRHLGMVPVILGVQGRKRAARYDQQCYRDRHLIENAFYQL